jgi:long-chain acyl-CoA synthetase
VARTQLEHFPNLVTMFLARVREHADKPFLWSKHDAAWRSIS